MSSTIKNYISSFNKKLLAVNIKELGLQQYPENYLQLIIRHSNYYLHIYSHVFEKLLDNTSKIKEEIILLDYGAGNGLLGLFAKFCGFKKVYLNDYSPIFLDASKRLATALQIDIDSFIEGDCSAVAEFCLNNYIPDAVVGTDVIEHIYSLDDFFCCIKAINKRMVTVFTTASVTSNPIKNRHLIKLQKTDELVASNAEHAVPGNPYAGLPFLKIRKQIINKNFPMLKDEDLNKLARATRGLKAEDIIKAVQAFVTTSILPIPPLHLTNTCDPVTGSWTERLLTPAEYILIYKEANFNATFYNGFYNEWQPGIKGFGLKIINRLITLSAGVGKTFAPFITIVGKT